MYAASFFARHSMCFSIPLTFPFPLFLARADVALTRAPGREMAFDTSVSFNAGFNGEFGHGVASTQTIVCAAGVLTVTDPGGNTVVQLNLTGAPYVANGFKMLMDRVIQYY